MKLNKLRRGFKGLVFAMVGAVLLGALNMALPRSDRSDGAREDRATALIASNSPAWTPRGSIDEQVLAVAATGGRVLAGTQYDGLMSLAPGSAAPVLGQAIAVVSPGAGGLVAGTRNGGGVHRSTDGGDTWAQLGLGPAADDVLSFATHSGELFAGTDHGVFALVGGSWSPRSAGLGGRVVTSMTALPGSLFAGTDHGVFRSSDAGASWVAAGSGPGDVAIRALATVGTTLLAGSANGLHRSTDSGASWTAVSGVPAGGVTSLVTRAGPPWDLVVVGAVNGVLISRDAGQSLAAFDGNLPASARRVHSVAMSAAPLCPHVVLLGTDAGVYETNHDCGGPVAVADAARTPQYTAVRVPVLANDSDPDGDALSIVAVGTPARGTARANADGTITYSPSSRFKGSDSFTYRVSDGDDEATATVTITEIGCGENGPLSRPIDREVEPKVADVNPGAARELHDANCEVIAGVADQ